MALYKQEQASGETALAGVTFEVYNSKSGADADEYLAAYADMSDTVKALIRTSLLEGAAEPRADELLADIGEKLKPDCVSRVYDAWASDVSFDPAAIECEEAAWIAMDGKGGQAAFKVHLTEDRDSPCGFGWYTEPSYWDAEERCWKPDYDAGGIWWGYKSAAALEAEFPECENVNWRDERLKVVRVEPELLAEIGVDDYAQQPRTASEQELDAASKAKWPDAGIRYPHYTDLERTGGAWQSPRRGAGVQNAPRITLKKHDGLWSCAVAANIQGQPYLTTAMAPTFLGAYSKAFRALSARCDLSNMNLMVVSPLNPSRPFYSIDDLFRHEGVNNIWEPAERERRAEVKPPAKAPEMVRAAAPAPTRAAR